LFKEQNYKNGELYHIKESCENIDELEEFLDTNLFLFSNDFDNDINLKEENNIYFASFSKIGI